jgi:hypothetical protein
MSGNSAARSVPPSGWLPAVATWNATPRSMRRTAESPQFFAMSVAFRRPRRKRAGTRNHEEEFSTLVVRATARSSCAPYVSSRSSVRRSASSSARSVSTKCQYSAETEGDGIAGAGGRERGVKLGDAKGRQRVAPA